MYIVARHSTWHMRELKWPSESAVQPSIYDILEDDSDDIVEISDRYAQAMSIWNEFLERFPIGESLPSFPIWAMEFGADYPACSEQGFPGQLSERQLRRYHGVLGRRLSDVPSGQRFASLPTYAQYDEFPSWKQSFIRQNRHLYARHKSWLRGWKRQLDGLPASLQKLEWNCQGERRDIWSHIVQFRASGIRVKRDSSAPALVAMTATQVPVVASRRRYLTVGECARLQSLESLQILPSSRSKAYGALGNAVNSRMISLIARSVIKSHSPTERSTRVKAPRRVR